MLTTWHGPYSPAVAAERRPCSNRSISPGRRAHSSKAAASGLLLFIDGMQTDGHHSVT